jgi:hypothetical protein
MAKRFADTNKYKKPFIRSLPGAYKLLWDFLYLDCDHAGIWIVDFDVAQMYIGSDMKISREEALKFFNTEEVRIFEFDGKKKWFIIPFIEFQYGRLSEKNKAVSSVITILKKYGFLDEDLHLTIPPSSPLQGAKDKVKEKDKDKEMDKDGKMLCPKMVSVFKASYPEYPSDQEVDFPACLLIAYKIAKSKGWMKEAVVNGKLDETVAIWEEIVKFSKTDQWFSSRSITDFNKEYQRLIQKMNNGAKPKGTTGKTMDFDDN